jgi:hypothetical protein
LALAASGETPWQWGYRPQDIVAGRVFGDAQADFADDCLLVTSRGQPFEIGLRLERSIPLRDFPRLRLFAFANAAAQVQLVVRERLDGGAWTSAPFPLAGIFTATNIDMERSSGEHSMAWRFASRKRPPCCACDSRCHRERPCNSTAPRSIVP